ncbi:MAG: hypothetical protein RSB86_03600 [Comamonas sp.]|uniref:hypothetical protein n=1 Tax=Comamonas sp. TaxID=34028 RepID=UPI002FCC8A44
MVSPVLLALKIFSTPLTLETTPAPAHLHMLVRLLNVQAHSATQRTTKNPVELLQQGF